MSFAQSVLVALPMILIGVAVLLLALDSRIARQLRVEHGRRLDQHAEAIHEVQHREQVAAGRYALDRLRDRVEA